MTRQSDSQLGVDLGTTHTVAALTSADGRSQPLLFDASFLLPSSVFAEVDGHLLTGKDAERSARLDPSRFEPNPKRRIDDGTVLLGAREYPVSDLLAAVLRRTADEASRVLGIMPVRTVLTYPANWATHRRAVLADAAARAGMPAPILVPEPIAAAAYFTTVMGRQIPPGGVLVVYDFGGGTFDTSVLRRRPDGGWDVLASDGLPDVGGVDLDAALVTQIGQTLTMTDAERWRQLTDPGDDVSRRRSFLLREDVRTAKEQLSRTSSAGVHVPLFEIDMHVTRAEFEQVSRPYLQRTVDLTANTLQRAGVRPDQIAGMFLVGGSSRIPMVSTLLHQRLGVAPTIIEQPELVVALGSAIAAMPGRPAPGPVPGYPAGPRPPGMGAPMGAPVSGPAGAGAAAAAAMGAAAPVSAPVPGPISPAGSPASPPTWLGGLPPSSGVPVSAPPTSGMPHSGPPASGPPVSGPPGAPLAAPLHGAPGGFPPGGGFAAPGGPGAAFGAQPPSAPTAQFGHGGPATPGGPPNGLPPFGPPPVRRTGSGGGKTALLVGIALAVVLLLGVGGVVTYRAVSDDKATDNPTVSATGNRGSGNGGTVAGPANTKDAKPGAKQQTVEINKAVWYGQVKLTFGKMVYEADADQDPLVVEVQMENLGDDTVQSYGVRMAFQLDGQEYSGSFKESSQVSGGQKSNFHVSFAVYDPLKVSIGSGTLLIGDGKEAQPKVPLGGGEVVAYEPVNVLKDKKLAIHDLEVMFATCDVRGGYLDFNGQALKDNRVLTCKLDIRYNGKGSQYIGAEHFRLGLPDGTEVAPKTAPNEAMSSGSENLAPARNLGFQFKYVPGTYKLRVVDIAGDARKPSDVVELDIIVK
ncbi:Hsp70 family protein [Dactylosporangium sp. NPDC049525]|uniref:Hsp70 family protein n=1 Tax=Dactylosporangium sp. NPDC049525 TaxID=3154730 RepID=UPI0034158AD4